MDLNELKIDAAKAERGAWVRDIPGMGDVALKVRAIWNSDWERLHSKLFDAAPRSKKAGGKLDADEARRIADECLIQTALIDWSGLKSDGKPLPYSQETARKLITDPDFVQFRNGVLYAAGVVANEGQENLSDALGN